MSASYHRLVMAQKALIKKLHGLLGVDEGLIKNFIHFTQCMLEPDHDLIDEKIFRAVLLKYFNLIDQRLVHKLFYNFTKEQNGEGMTVENFCHILCLFFTSDEDKRIDYVFAVIDLDEDFVLQKHQLGLLIRPARCMTDIEDEEKEDTYVELCNLFFKLLGIEDKCLDINIFRKRVKEDPLFAYLLGQIIPASEVVIRFRDLIKGKTYRQIRNMFGTIRYDLLHEVSVYDHFKHYPIEIDYP